MDVAKSSCMQYGCCKKVCVFKCVQMFVFLFIYLTFISKTVRYTEMDKSVQA